VVSVEFVVVGVSIDPLAIDIDLFDAEVPVGRDGAVEETPRTEDFVTGSSSTLSSSSNRIGIGYVHTLALRREMAS